LDFSKTLTAIIIITNCFMSFMDTVGKTKAVTFFVWDGSGMEGDREGNLLGREVKILSGT
jgi:hypothetical protein